MCGCVYVCECEHVCVCVFFLRGVCSVRVLYVCTCVYVGRVWAHMM